MFNNSTFFAMCAVWAFAFVFAVLGSIALIAGLLWLAYRGAVAVFA